MRGRHLDTKRQAHSYPQRKDKRNPQPRIADNAVFDRGGAIIVEPTPLLTPPKTSSLVRSGNPRARSGARSAPGENWVLGAEHNHYTGGGYRQCAPRLPNCYYFFRQADWAQWRAPLPLLLFPAGGAVRTLPTPDVLPANCHRSDARQFPYATVKRSPLSQRQNP